MEEKRKRGRPPKSGETMTGAQRTREYRKRKKEEERKKLSIKERIAARKSDRDYMEMEQKKRRRTIERTLKNHPKIMKEFLTIQVEYRSALRVSIEAAAAGRFSPESKQIIRKRKEELDLLHEQFLEILDKQTI